MPTGREERQNEKIDDEFIDEEDAFSQGQQDHQDERAGQAEYDLEDEFEEAGEADEGEDVGQPPRRARQPDPEIERLRRENELLRQQQQAQRYEEPRRVQREETEQEFQQRIAALEPVEQMNLRLQRAEQRSNQQLAYLQATTTDQLDRASYAARAASDKRFAKYSDEVERRHAEFLRGGPNQPPQLVARETILKIVIAEKILGQSNREQRRSNERQQRRTERQRVNPPNNRGDAGSGRPDRRGGRQNETEAEARQRRLENLEI